MWPKQWKTKVIIEARHKHMRPLLPLCSMRGCHSDCITPTIGFRCSTTDCCSGEARLCIVLNSKVVQETRELSYGSIIIPPTASTQKCIGFNLQRLFEAAILGEIIIATIWHVTM